MAIRNLALNLGGRVKKVKTDNMLVSLYEAVSNAIHAIEERGKGARGITVEILRNSRQGDLGVIEERAISGFRISDDGTGFDERNFASFGEADTTLKAQKGGKGVGRFSWLKFFERVEVSSSFSKGTKMVRREFTFTLQGIEETREVELVAGSPFETSVLLSPLFPKYEQKARKSLDDVAIGLVEHFVAYLATDSLPPLVVKDGAAQKDLRTLYQESLGKSSVAATFTIGDKTFKTVGIKNYLGHSTHAALLCGHRRVADRALLGSSDQFLAKRFSDENLRTFAYNVFVESEYLDSIVNDDRDGFRFPESGSLEGAAEGAVTKEKILQKVVEIVKEQLSPEIEKKRKENIETVERYVTQDAPQYRYVVKKHIDEIAVIHDSEPEKIDLALRRIQFEEEVKVRVAAAALMRQADEKDVGAKEDWDAKSKEIIAILTDNGKANLASYIAQRKVALEVLKKRMEISGEKYAREQAIHELIFPMQTTSDDVSFEQQNLWIIDERLAYHYYLASDKPLVSIPPAGSDSSKEPDIIVFNRPIALNDKPESERPDSIVIVEFKRPGESAVRGDKNPVDQILEYIELIKEGKASNRKGRPINVQTGTYFFGYVICEIDTNLKKVLSRRTMRETPDGRGLFGYFENHRAYVEVIGYDKMLDDAMKRNRILFDKLQLPP